MQSLVLSVFLYQFSSTAGVHFSASTKFEGIAGDETDTSLVFNMFEVQQPGLSPRPEEDYYRMFYKAYEGQHLFVKDMPDHLFQNVASVELYILRAKLSTAFESRGSGMAPAETGKGVDPRSLTHNGVGCLLKDKEGNELRRISFSYWGICGNKVDFTHLKSDGRLGYFNRAVLAYTVTKGNWEWGYWTDKTYMSELSPETFRKVVDFSRNWGVQHPYIRGTELMLDGQLLAPAITCNTYVHELIWEFTKRDIYEEKILAMAFFSLDLSKQEKVKLLREIDDVLPASKTLTPIWYNAHGVLKEVGNQPYTIYVSEQADLEVTVRSNMGEDVKLTIGR